MQIIQCRDCEQWAPEDQWAECETPCELCGDHSGIQCPFCDECHDEIHYELVREGL